MRTQIAKWQTSGRDYLILERDDNKNYWFRGNGCGGGFNATDDSEAIEKMEAPWGEPHVGQVTILKTDRPSLKRVS